jgi:hypothetical protein
VLQVKALANTSNFDIEVSLDALEGYLFASFADSEVNLGFPIGEA